MTNSSSDDGKKGKSWLANAGGFASGALLGYHVTKEIGEARHKGGEKSDHDNQSQTGGSAGHAFQVAAHTEVGTGNNLYMGAEGQQGGPANEGEDRILDTSLTSLDVGTEGPNGGPNRDPDLVSHHGVDRMGTESPRGGPSDDPERAFDHGLYPADAGHQLLHQANFDVGPSSPNGGPSNDPDLAP